MEAAAVERAKKLNKEKSENVRKENETKMNQFYANKQKYIQAEDK